MEEKIDRQPPERLEDDVSILTANEQATAAQLRLMDPQLAGLYERGIRLMSQIHQPENVYLLAHCGRELSNGVLQLLLDEGGLPTSVQEDEHRGRIAGTFHALQSLLDEKGLAISVQEDEHRRRIADAFHALQSLLDEEGLATPVQGGMHRPLIAHALGLPDDHLRVNAWYEVHRYFTDDVHWRRPGPSADVVRGAFARFSSLLYGLIAPYFDTESELDSLLEIELPTVEHARRLNDLLFRLGQRNYFFGRLTNPAWVEPLADAGFFSNPPDRQVNPDESWSARAWPEGNYLVEAAAGARAAVAAVLEAVPSSNDNPAVWDIVARAARQLPSGLAVRMVPSLTNALETVPARFFSESVVDLAVVLAEAERSEAFELANYLLYVVAHREVDEEARKGLQYTSRTDWVFPRFGYHSQDELCTRLLAALETRDPEKTLQFLLTKIQRVERLADGLDLGLSWRLMRLETERQSNRDDVVAMLVVGAVALTQRMGAKGPDEAEWVMEAIDSHNGEFFSRIRYRVLAQVGNHLQDRLDQVLRSEEARNPSFHAADLAALLRAQFRNASSGTRQDYADAVRAGPDRGWLHRILRLFRADAAKAESDRHWQRRILRFFRGDIPAELRDLARELGVLGVEPSYREQQMAEVGGYSNGVSSGWGESPVSAQQLSAWTADDVVAFLREWQPSEQFGSAFELQGSLATHATNNARVALSVLNRAVEDGVHPSAIEGILDGLGEAAKAEADLDWGEALAGVGRVMRHVTTLDVNGTQSIEQWRRTAGRGARLIEEGCRKNSIPFELAPEVWTLLDEATRVPAIWRVEHYQQRSLGAVITAKLNDASGNVANAVMSGALWDYRCRTRRSDRSEEKRAQARGGVQEPLLPILDRWLEDERPNAAVPRAVMGDYLSQLHLLAPEWIEAHAPDLFQGGLEDPMTRPTWTTYVSRSPLYGTVFEALRPWYARAAKKAAVWAAAAGDVVGTRDPTQKLAVHLIVAFLRQLVSVGDEDGLLETAYENLSPSDWGHAYWAVFRDFTDAKEPVSESLVQRLVDLWEWRILELQKDEGSDRTVEEAKALGWLFHTPHIPAADLIRLGQATARLARGHIEMYSRWEHMLVLAQSDPDGAFDIANSVLRAQLRSGVAYVAVEEVRPFLQHVLMAGSLETQDRARNLINELGERGFRELKDLLQE